MSKKRVQRVAIDVFVPEINPHCGMGKAIGNLIRILDERAEEGFQFYAFGFRRSSVFRNLKHIRYIRLPAPLVLPGRWGRRLQRLFAELARQFFLPVLVLVLRLDAIHFTSQIPFALYPCRVYMTLYDLAYRTLSADALARGFSPRYWAWRITRGLRFCTRIATISEFSRSEALRYFDLQGDRLRVIHLPFYPLFEGRCDSAAQSSRLEEVRRAGGGGFLLFVGELGRNKNEARILEAYRASGIAAPFVFVIGRTTPAPALCEMVRSYGLERKVFWFTDVADEELEWLYGNATALVFASLYEGFGLPILEAFAAKTPVLTSSRAAMPEIAGDAAVLVEPESVGSICAGILEIMGDEGLRGRLVRNGERRLEFFSPGVLREQFVDFYRL